MTNSFGIRIEVQEGDVLTFAADVLALKYARFLYGADQAVYDRLQESGHPKISLPRVNRFKLIPTHGSVTADMILFVGVLPLNHFRYEEIREFGRKVLVSLAEQAPKTEHLALTIHGPGYGLDEIEAFESELAGVVEAINAGYYPGDLRRVSFVERNPGRARRLQAVLDDLIPGGIVGLNPSKMPERRSEQSIETLRTVGYNSAAKPRVFVAMPFAEAMDDLFHYGIQGAVKSAGFLCERADLASFVGDVMEWVKQRICSAEFVIADLSTANPNVYLEVGYAWGCNRPTILLVRDTNELKFDVKGQRCLVYKSIKHLEELLGKELEALKAGGASA